MRCGTALALTLARIPLRARPAALELGRLASTRAGMSAAAIRPRRRRMAEAGRWGRHAGMLSRQLARAGATTRVCACASPPSRHTHHSWRPDISASCDRRHNVCVPCTIFIHSLAPEREPQKSIPAPVERASIALSRALPCRIGLEAHLFLGLHEAWETVRGLLVNFSLIIS